MASRCISRSCSQLTASTPSSVLQAFLQVAPRRAYHNTPPPVLDFLLPSIPNSTLQARTIWARDDTKMRQPGLQFASCRTFTSSCRKQQTTAVHNPRQDDDGNYMNIEITPRASNRLKEIMSKDANPNLALRIQVESGGCHGFQYLISLTTLPPLPLTSPKSGSQSIELESAAAPNTSTTEPNAVSSTTPDKIPAALDEDDTVFAAKDGSGAMVVMDGPSLELLRGSKVDYTMELIGSQFKIVDNPFATSSCGCGTSFDIKV